VTRVEKVLLLLLPVPFAVGLLTPGAAVAPIAGTPVFAFQDQAIDESSGLVADGRLVVTVNDSGDSARIFTVDAATGRTVGRTHWQGGAVDNEALAPAGKGSVWVGDIGDNQGKRDHVVVSKVPFGRGDRTVHADSYRLVYPDGPHDAESLLADPRTGRLYVVAKEFIGRMYAAPAKLDPDRPNRLEPVGEVLGIATDGAFLPDGRHLVLRNYGQAAIYTWPGLEQVERFDLPVQKQGEGLAVEGDGRTALLSSEGVGSEVLRVALPAAAPAATQAADPDPRPSQEPQSPRRPEPEQAWWPWAAGGGALVVLLGLAARSRARRNG
jgi:hypothetical protein